MCTVHVSYIDLDCVWCVACSQLYLNRPIKIERLTIKTFNVDFDYFLKYFKNIELEI